MGQEGSRNCFHSFVEITDDDEDMHRFNKEVHKRLAALPRRAKENLARWYHLAHPPPPPPKTPAATYKVIKDAGMDDAVLAALDRDPTWTVERYEDIIWRSFARHVKRQMRPSEQRDHVYIGSRRVKLRGESTDAWFADFWNAVLQYRVCGWSTALNHYGEHWVENHW
jgi:hypothetical protein